MVTVGSEDVRTSWGATLDKAHAGKEEIVIQRHGRPIAVLMSYDQWLAQRDRHMALLAQRSDEVDNGDYLTHDEVMKGLQDGVGVAV
jgi:prevent-host-death family protein